MHTDSLDFEVEATRWLNVNKLVCFKPTKTPENPISLKQVMNLAPHRRRKVTTDHHPCKLSICPFLVHAKYIMNAYLQECPEAECRELG